MEIELGHRVRSGGVSIRLLGQQLGQTMRSRVPIMLALSLLIGSSVGSCNSYRHWRVAVDETAQTLADASVLLDSMAGSNANSSTYQSVLEAVATGANLDKLSYQRGDRRWDAFANPAVATVIDNTSMQIAHGNRSINGMLVTEVPKYHVMRIDLLAALGVALAVYLALSFAPCLISNRSRSRNRVKPWRLLAEDVDDDAAWNALHLREAHANQLHDTAERVRRAERLLTMRHLVEKVSHELRNPLAAMQATLSRMALESGEHSERESGMRLRLERHMAQVVFALGELQTFGNAYQHQDDLLDVAKQLIANAHTDLSDTRIVVRAPAAERCRIYVDAERFNATIAQLLDNALLAVEARRKREPGLRGDIVLHTWQRGERVVIAVDDNGTGVSARARERLFDPFFTTRADRFGLGLALIKQFAEHYGGSVRAVNKKVGCRIELILPSAGRADDNA